MNGFVFYFYRSNWVTTDVRKTVVIAMIIATLQQ